MSVCVALLVLFLKSELGEKQNKGNKQHQENPYEDESPTHRGHFLFSLSTQEGTINYIRCTIENRSQQFWRWWIDIIQMMLKINELERGIFFIFILIGNISPEQWKEEMNHVVGRWRKRLKPPMQKKETNVKVSKLVWSPRVFPLFLT